MRAKSGEIYTTRAVQREDEADGRNIENPRKEREGGEGREQEGNAQQSLPPETVLVGGFVGVEGKLPHWVVLVMLG